MNARKREELQLAGDGALRHVALVAVHAVPFVHRHHHGPPALEDESGDVRVLVRDLPLGVQHEDRDVGPIDGLQGLHDRELLDAFENLPAASQSGGIDEDVASPLDRELHVDRIARGARLLERHDALLTDQRVDECGLPGVGAAHDGDPDCAVGFAALLFNGEIGKCGFNQVVHPLPVLGGNRVRHAQPHFVEFERRERGLHALGLVDRDEHAPAEAPQLLSDRAVPRREALAGVGHEDDDVGFGDCGSRLLGHLDEYSARFRSQPAGIDREVRPLAQASHPIVAVSRQTRDIGDQCIPGAREPVEQRGLADIGPADDDESGFHDEGPRLVLIRLLRAQGEQIPVLRLHQEPAVEPHEQRSDRAAVGGDAAEEGPVFPRKEMHVALDVAHGDLSP